MIVIRSLEDLNKMITTQKVVIRKVKDQQVALAMGNTGTPEDLEKLKERQKNMLVRYAVQPTLMEDPALKGGLLLGKWGATFGITLLVHNFILTPILERNPSLDAPLLKSLFVAYLAELKDSKHEYIADALKAKATFHVRDVEGNIIEGENRENIIFNMMNELLRYICAHSEAYGLVDSKGNDRWVINKLGLRVLEHLLAGQKYVDIVVEAHTRFQQTKTRLALV